MKLTSAEELILKKAYQEQERERYINERDNPVEFANANAYITERDNNGNEFGYIQDNGKNYKLIKDLTPETQILRIKITPHKGPN
jgi:hypothetical protein